ncbi:MAG: phosphatidylglycerol lysyltransferase domain-containing protein [Muribaculaceae bacterium]|nr:phosphatidylglycerol lysyltransferase domain-containing protein [Muribaculaceae bacterium]
MNTHRLLLSPSAAFATAPALHRYFSAGSFREASVKELARRLDFRKISHSDMPAIWSILKNAPGRTTDFSYAGLLMWVDFFNYEFSIINDTLFIKGRVEDDLSKPAFSMPIGAMPLDFSIDILKEYCRNENIRLEFSAVPETSLEDFKPLNPRSIEALEDWSDYLYSADSLATLCGKKYGKKRNHVNQFLAAYPDYELSPLEGEKIDMAIEFMDKIDIDGDRTPMAIAERKLNRKMLAMMKNGDDIMEGAILTDGHGEVLGFTIGDVKGDTLFVHIEKALHDTPGGFEMLNKSFAARMKELHPEIQYINREDDAGDPGLRRAKESYHPVELLRKYNIVF